MSTGMRADEPAQGVLDRMTSLPSSSGVMAQSVQASATRGRMKWTPSSQEAVR